MLTSRFYHGSAYVSQYLTQEPFQETPTVPGSKATASEDQESRATAKMPDMVAQLIN